MAVLVVLCFVVFKFILSAIRVEGISMLPTYQDGSAHFVNRLAYLWHEPRRGDVVSIRLAGTHVMYLKRIIGLPGETVAFVNGQVLINGEVLDEPYEKLLLRLESSARKTRPGRIFCRGRQPLHAAGISQVWKSRARPYRRQNHSYENCFPPRLVRRAGGAWRLAVVRFVSQPGKGHPQAPHGTRPHRFIFIGRRQPGAARRRAKSGRLFRHQCRGEH